MTMFIRREFTAHSGQRLGWKVDCDALTGEDWAALASVVARSVTFGEVEGVPRGGTAFADALRPYATPGGPLLIADDVLTTGASMEEHRAGRSAIGAVAFARGPLLPWVRAVWTLTL